MLESTKFVALDQHLDSITVATAVPGRGKPAQYGQIASTPDAVAKLARRLDDGQTTLRFCYEAGPCGYGVYRELTATGYECTVVAPSLIPRRSGERIKTDRRDAVTLARCHRNGDLVSVWVPGEEQEALRDLVRCREDMKTEERRMRQRLSSFLLRHGRTFGGRKRWTQAHYRWLEQQCFSQPDQQIVFQVYVDAVRDRERCVEELEGEMERALEGYSLRPVVEGLMALRGVSRLVAMTVVVELGDLTRFDSPRQLMAYVGLVPSEHSSGGSRRQGGITKTGNAHVRRVLAQSAWCYRFQARKTAVLQRRAEKTTPQTQAIAWEAQKRLCGRYQYLVARGKTKQTTCTAIARELLGFIWAIARECMPTNAAVSE